MSRIGKLPVELPEGIKAQVSGRSLKVVGPKGELEYKFSRLVGVAVDGSQVKVSRRRDDKASKAIHGTTRALINNMVKGVKDGWVKNLQIVGKGYRAEAKQDRLVLTVGYSHPVEIVAPDGVSFKVEKDNIAVSGMDKGLVGQVAARLRKVRPPEPYKGKGIRYLDEVVRRKPGKAAKGAEGAIGQ